MKPLFTFIIFVSSMFVKAQPPLYIYGGSNHRIYLGCINCDDYNTNSIWNEYGIYGSDYSQFSPWNSYATYPPIIVDKQGNFYGYFTVNEYKAKRWESRLALTLYRYYEKIKKDISYWYKNIFG